MTAACLGCAQPATASGFWANVPLAWCAGCDRLSDRKKNFLLHEAIAGRMARELAHG